MAFHKDLNVARKYLKPLHIGHLHQEDSDTPLKGKDMKQDFKQLRLTAEKMVSESI